MKVEFTPEDILTGLYKLAYVGAGKAFNIDLIKVEKLSGVPVDIETVCGLAMVGAESKDERDFVRVCESVLVKDKPYNEEEITHG